MPLLRREVLGAFGVASASTLLWALGCGASTPQPRRAAHVSRDVRSWLHDAVTRLAAIYPDVHALAVSRTRTTAAVDVLGPGIARMRADGAVLTVRRGDGTCREHVTSQLTADGINAAAAALAAAGAAAAAAPIDFGPVPAPRDEPPRLDDRDLRHRVELLLHNDPRPSSRIVYAAAVLDVDDAIVWSVAPGRDLEQRLVRIRQCVTRAAWNGSRPVVASVERAWSGSVDEQSLTRDDLAAASDAALKLMTPGPFPDGDHTIVLDPSAAALVLDVVARYRLTGAIPAIAPGPLDTPLASPLITLIDDPTPPGAYGGYAFDDEGQLATPLTLLDGGRITAYISDRAATAPDRDGASAGAARPGGRGRRPGHLARVEPSSSHLRLLPGATDTIALYTDGFVLEGGLTTSFDPATDRLRLACARARELAAGNPTGRIYADVELVAPLTALLAATEAVAREPAIVILPGDPDVAIPGAPPRPSHWRSASTPALRTRGFVRARRPHA